MYKVGRHLEVNSMGQYYQFVINLMKKHFWFFWSVNRLKVINDQGIDTNKDFHDRYTLFNLF